MKQKLNILFLSSWYPSKVTTTKGNFVQRHAEAVATKCNVIAISVIEDPNVKSEKYNIERSLERGVDTIRVYTKPGMGRATKWIRFFNGHDKAIKLVLEKFNPDVIHGNVFFPVGIVAKKWAAKLGVPLVFTEHLTAYLPENRDNLKNKHLRSIKSTARLTQRIMPVSEDLMMAMKELNIGRAYEVVPNVVDTNLFKPQKKNNLRKKIIHVSTAKDFHKNVSGILRTIALLKEKRSDFELLIISDGILEPHIDLAKELRIEDVVHFEGEQPIDSIGQKMGGSDLFVLFSNFENLPCVIIEALSCGLPVVSTDVGGIPEMINESNGKLIKPKDENELLVQLNEVLDSDQFNSLEIARSAHEKYGIEAVSSQLLRIYQEVLLEME